MPPSEKQLAHRQRLADYWRSPEGRARRSELSRRPSHLEKLKHARDSRTEEQLQQARDALTRWNASGEAVDARRERLQKIRDEWLYSEENLDHLAELHESWARSEENLDRLARLREAWVSSPAGAAQIASNRSGWQVYKAPLRARDGDLCQLCLEVMDFKLKKDPMSVSVDHITPRRAGGSDELENLWLAHLRCNLQKGAHYRGRKDGTTDPVRTD